MPKVHDEGGYQVYVYNPPREHGPAHVHVFRAEGEVVIDLDPVQVTEVYRMRSREIVRALRIIEKNREQLLEEWRRIHG